MFRFILCLIVLSLEGRLLGQSWSNPAPISIPSSGIATPYPSVSSVSGASGAIVSVSVTLTGLAHTWPEDIDILLVGPNGQKTVLMSDVGGGLAIGSATLKFEDQAVSSLPASTQISSGTYKPTNIGATDLFPVPAPSAPYDSTLAGFVGTGPNGDWKLYVIDDASRDQGSIDGGWTLTIATTAAVPPTISDIPNQSLVEDGATPALGFTVAHISAPASSLSVTASSGDTTLLPNQGIALGGSGNNRTISLTPAPNKFGNVTVTVFVSDGVSSANDTFVRFTGFIAHEGASNARSVASFAELADMVAG